MRNLRGYLKAGTIGGAIGTIPDLLIAGLRTIGPEYVRTLKPEYFVHPALVLIPAGVAIALGTEYVHNRRGEKTNQR